jgi:catechol 2,3-dioxygenase-like lactoylglutathione lyase family enzyme
MRADVFGTASESFEIARVAISDGIGVALFSFPHDVKESLAFKQFNTGLFHFCVQDTEIEVLVEKIVAHGGKQRMPIRAYYPNDKPFNMCYVEDPFGIVFEIYALSYELTYASGAYAK